MKGFVEKEIDKQLERIREYKGDVLFVTLPAVQNQPLFSGGLPYGISENISLFISRVESEGWKLEGIVPLLLSKFDGASGAYFRRTPADTSPDNETPEESE